MVAKVSSGKSIRGVLQYNARKVGKESAILLGASGVGSEGKGLTISEKLSLD